HRSRPDLCAEKQALRNVPAGHGGEGKEMRYLNRMKKILTILLLLCFARGGSISAEKTKFLWLN
ncbi:MAG: hypothetical protein MR828_10500, partial [Clostridiales bacterium]|nr:hypothetical protein [Clostridiales bacterium]